MASMKRFVFTILLLAQTALFVFYFVIRGFNMTSTTVLSTPIVSFNTVQTTLIDQNENSICIRNASLPKIAINILSENLKNRQTSQTAHKVTLEGHIEHGDGNTADKVSGANLPVRSPLHKQFNDNTIREGQSIQDTKIPALFQPIDGKEAWLYSAFFDHVAAQEGTPLVRIFGVVRFNYLMKVYCVFNPNVKGPEATGNIIAFPDQHKKLYRTSYVICPLKSNLRPTYVSVSFQTKEKQTNHLPILYPGPRIRNFTVCYSVLHSRFNMAMQLIVSLEMNRILGAEHFLVYNYSISPEVDQILRRYQDDGLVTVLQWPITTNGTWYFAQVATLNDCFYRNRNTSRFVVVVDTDELLLPRYHNTWMELIHGISPKETGIFQFFNSSKVAKEELNITGSFTVRACYFLNSTTPKWDSIFWKLPFSETEAKNIIKYNILPLSQFSRSDFIYPHHKRAKYIARPELVFISGIHKVMKFTNRVMNINVNESHALVHHYRVPKKKIVVTDTSILKYKQDLYTSVMKQIARFREIFP